MHSTGYHLYICSRNRLKDESQVSSWSPRERVRAQRVSWMLCHLSMLTKNPTQLAKWILYKHFSIAIFQISIAQVNTTVCARVDWCTCCLREYMVGCYSYCRSLTWSHRWNARKLNSIRNSTAKAMILCAFPGYLRIKFGNFPKIAIFTTTTKNIHIRKRRQKNWKRIGWKSIAVARAKYW